jgi:hypothetical protein
VVGWGEIEIKATSAQLELELGLSLAKNSYHKYARQPFQLHAYMKALNIAQARLRSKLTSTRVIHKCVYANQEYINLQKDYTGYLKYG